MLSATAQIAALFGSRVFACFFRVAVVRSRGIKLSSFKNAGGKIQPTTASVLDKGCHEADRPDEQITTETINSTAVEFLRRIRNEFSNCR